MTPTHPSWLYEGGICDMIEVAAGQKYPVAKDWPAYRATRDEVERWTKQGSNVGLLAAHYPGIDIDITDPELAKQIATLVQRRLGTGPIRTGQLPKLLLPYRTEHPFPKRRITLGDKGAVEALGDGQQYVIWGRHPSGATYKWLGGTELATVSAADVDAVLGEIAELAEMMGITAHAHVGAEGGHEARPEKAPSLAAIQLLLAQLPNDELPYDEWCAVAHAVKGAAPDEADPESVLSVFIEWSARSQKHIAAESERVFRAAKPRHAGWQSLMARAQRVAPVAAASAEFGTGEAVAALPKPLDRSELMASLLGSAEKPFMLEYSELQGDAFIARWRQLSEAAMRRGPLAAVYETRVLPRAVELRPLTDDPKLFERALGAKVGTELRKELALSAADVWLLLETARLDVTPIAKLLPNRRYLGHAKDEDRGPDVVEEFVPAGALVGVAGPPGSGKSWVAGALSLAVARGESFCGRAANRTGPVWYFSSEYTLGVRDRLRADQAARGAAPDLVLFDGSPNLASVSDTMQAMLRASELAGERAAPALVVIDIFRGSFDGDENESSAVALATRNARIFCRALGASVVIVHHTSKARPDDPRGSNAFEAELDTLFTIAKTGNHSFRLGTRKHREGKFPAGNFHIVDNLLAERDADPDMPEERNATMRHELARRAARAIWAGQSVREFAKVLGDAGMDYGCNSERTLRRKIGEVLHEFAVDLGWVQATGDRPTWQRGPVEPPLEPITFRREYDEE